MNRRIIRNFSRDDRGAIIVFWAVSLAFLLAAVALSFDLGERASAQADLQSYADQVALAAAGELDGHDDSVTRAAAAAALVTDTQSFKSGGGKATLGAADITLSYYATLPSSDTTALGSALNTGTTAGQRAAIYVRAVVSPRLVPFHFTNAFKALTGATNANTTITASAVAGFNQYACDITPMMFCLPSPSYKADAHIGEMILLRTGGQNSAWGPGDFGFLNLSEVSVDPNGPCAHANGQNLTRCLVGAVGGLHQCYSQRGVDIEPGQKSGIENGAFNVRFDIFENSFKSNMNDASYAPAPDVIKGQKPKAVNCNNGYQVTTDTAALPRDNCFATSTCGNGGRVGNGNWSNGRTNYFTKNYGVANKYPTATTRYAVYLAEIAAAGGVNLSTPILTGRTETGRQQCAPTHIADTERRVIVAAGIDCAANNVQGSANNIPVTEFFRLFLTEPVGGANNTNQFDIYAEVIGSAQTTSTGGSFHDVVQLYR